MAFRSPSQPPPPSAGLRGPEGLPPPPDALPLPRTHSRTQATRGWGDRREPGSERESETERMSTSPSRYRQPSNMAPARHRAHAPRPPRARSPSPPLTLPSAPASRPPSARSPPPPVNAPDAPAHALCYPPRTLPTAPAHAPDAPAHAPRRPCACSLLPPRARSRYHLRTLSIVPCTLPASHRARASRPGTGSRETETGRWAQASQGWGAHMRGSCRRTLRPPAPLCRRVAVPRLEPREDTARSAPRRLEKAGRHAV